MTPASEIEDEDVLTEVQLGLEEDPPTPTSVASLRAIEAGVDVAKDLPRRVRVGRRGAGRRNQLAVQDLGDQVIGHRQKILVGGGPACCDWH